jgi:hypothetical protein
VEENQRKADPNPWESRAKKQDMERTPWAGPLLETPIHDRKKITQKQKDQKPM